MGFSIWWIFGWKGDFCTSVSFVIFGYIWFSGLQVISYYSNRGGLGGVSLVTLKGEETVSQLLIKDANEKDEVSVFIFHVCLKRGETVETNCFFRDPTCVILHVVLMQQLASLFLTVSDILFRVKRERSERSEFRSPDCSKNIAKLRPFNCDLAISQEKIIWFYVEKNPRNHNLSTLTFSFHKKNYLILRWKIPRNRNVSIMTFSFRKKNPWIWIFHSPHTLDTYSWKQEKNQWLLNPFGKSFIMFLFCSLQKLPYYKDKHWLRPAVWTQLLLQKQQHVICYFLLLLLTCF